MSGPEPHVRRATVGDAAACAAIYAPYVTDTAISFETEPPSVPVMAGRIERALRAHDWLVLEAEPGGRVVGYAYAGAFAPRAAYRWSCEVSVYVEVGGARRGAGRTLYEALLERLAQLGYRTAFGGMTLPNAASEGLHRALGFEPAGVYRQVGFKHGTWHDVAWSQRALGPSFDSRPQEPGVGRSAPRERDDVAA